MQADDKIHEVESVRGLAALLIVFNHLPGWWPDFYALNFVRNTYLMVDLFFVLSGFVIYRAYAHRLHNWTDVLRFQFLRFGRLYPVHLCFLLAFLMLEVVKYIAVNHYGVPSPNTTPFKENGVIAFMQNAFLIQAIGNPVGFKTFNLPSWSISTEFYTYIIFAAGILFFKKFKNLFIFSAVLLAWLCLYTNQFSEFSDFIRCIFGFFIGCMAAQFYAAVPNLAVRILSGAKGMLICSVAVFLGFKSYDINLIDFYIVPLTVLIIFSIGNKNDALNKSSFLASKHLIWLGTISYSLYMCHTFVIFIVNQSLRMFVRPVEQIVGGKSTPVLAWYHATFFYVLCILISLCLAHLVYKYIESPWRLKSRRFINKNY
jgi:peptidoglycan/LPS O-acetylase OafA/YrhL